MWVSLIFSFSVIDICNFMVLNQDKFYSTFCEQKIALVFKTQ